MCLNLVNVAVVTLENITGSANGDTHARSLSPTDTKPDPNARSLTFGVGRTAIARPMGLLLTVPVCRRGALPSRRSRRVLRVFHLQESTAVCRLPCALPAGRGRRSAGSSCCCCGFAYTNHASFSPFGFGRAVGVGVDLDLPVRLGCTRSAVRRRLAIPSFSGTTAAA